jgi:hypothetical protein
LTHDFRCFSTWSFGSVTFGPGTQYIMVEHMQREPVHIMTEAKTDRKASAPISPARACSVTNSMLPYSISQQHHRLATKLLVHGPQRTFKIQIMTPAMLQVRNEHVTCGCIHGGPGDIALFFQSCSYISLKFTSPFPNI